jgi:hypothetical protein
MLTNVPMIKPIATYLNSVQSFSKQIQEGLCSMQSFNSTDLSELLRFWNLSIVRHSKTLRNKYKKSYLFLGILEMDKVQESSNSECYTLSSETFRIY